MLFSYEWLQEYIQDLPPADTLLEQLTLHSVEVEEVVSQTDIGDVVVGELLEAVEHPDADNLFVGQFDVGEEQPRQIVYADKAVLNVGDKLPIALAPTIIAGDKKIKKGKFRGVASQGMACLNSELGILDRADSVHFFDAETVNGTSVAELIPMDEVLIDIDNKSMTHRADLFSHANMAREIAAVFNVAFSYPQLQPLPKGLPELDVTIEDTDACSRYMGAVVEVEVGESPDFIKRRLQASGVKVINNVVDITNYVMLELGEPMHAFDADVMAEEKIIVRRAQQGEAILTLDKDTKKLTEDILVIAGVNVPMAVAGVIGGLETGVTSDTKRIVLEAATFEPLGVRKAGAAIGVRTDSLLRWEKGLVPGFAERGMARALELLKEHAAATVVKFTDQYPQENVLDSVDMQMSQLERLSGMEWTVEQVVANLSRLECTVEDLGDGVLRVTPPWFRKDLRIQEDIIEEVIRLHGVSTVPMHNLKAVLEVPKGEENLRTQRVIRDLLARTGAYEVLNHSFYGSQLVEGLGIDPEQEHVRIANPLSEDLEYLRVSMIPRMLENVATNMREQSEATFFEMGHIYFADKEAKQLGIVTYGEDAYRKVRGVVESLLNGLNIDWNGELIESEGECHYWEMYSGKQALRIDIEGEVAGTMGVLAPAAAKHLDIDTDVAFVVLSVDQLHAHRDSSAEMDALSAYPAIELDLSIIVDEQVHWNEIASIVYSQSNGLLQSVQPFDMYRGAEIGQGKKSIAFRMRLQSQEKTLQMETMERWRDSQLVKQLESKIGAQHRGV